MPFTHLDQPSRPQRCLRPQVPRRSGARRGRAGARHRASPAGGRRCRARRGRRGGGAGGAGGAGGRTGGTARGGEAVSRGAPRHLRGTLAADSVASLALQGGPMSAEEQRAFERSPTPRTRSRSAGPTRAARSTVWSCPGWGSGCRSCASVAVSADVPEVRDDSADRRSAERKGDESARTRSRCQLSSDFAWSKGRGT